MPLSAAITSSLSAFRKPLEDLYGSAKGAVKRKLKNLTAESRLREIYKAITSVQKVKTMWRIDKEVKLQSFYYPSKLLVANTPKSINSLSDISRTERFVIQGTVGQGKSIFLRYLCVQELALSQRIPVFLELRRYDAKAPFKSFLIDGLALYRIPSDESVFDYLAESGRLVLLLDAFDEVDPDSVTPVLAAVEALAQRYPQLQIVITSRPDSGIERSPHFRVYQLAPLTPNDHKPFLERIIDDAQRRREILEAIQRSGSDIRSLLQTPLLMTLLVIIYSATQEIPTSLSEFYENLFHTLLTRHDKTKPGFRRKRESRLSDTELRKLFEAFCYSARQNDILVFTNSTASALIERACKFTAIQCDAGAFLNDISKVACLMQQEGFEFHFTHKSVVEFHAACFIGRASEETARRFYGALGERKWMKWRQELEFLSQVDRHRYLKYFLVPSSLEAFRAFQIDIESDGDIQEDKVITIMNSITIAPNRANDEGPRGVGFSVPAFGGYIQEAIGMQALHLAILFCNAVINSQIEPITVGDLMVQEKKIGEATPQMTKTIKAALAQFRAARKELELESQVAEFVSP